jgi:competence ComEA-like helix-hairpin-helix protein
MKSWRRDFVKDYLTFSKKERNGVFILLVLCALFILFSRYFPVSRRVADKEAFQKELAGLKILIDTTHNAVGYQASDVTDYDRPKPADDYTARGNLFPFDPNTIDVAGWRKLGLREKTIQTIQNFVAKGYKFRQPDDLRKIYGLRKQEADRLVPYVQIAAEELNHRPSFDNQKFAATSKKPEFEVYKNKIVDINIADTSDFIALPGIGSKLATRIINFREKLGGFNSVDQIAETYGVPDSTFQKIKARLICDNSVLTKININTANASELKQHPYIKWNVANAIYNYRSQHGTYRSIEDLRKIDIIPDDLFNKIAPYLML